MGVTARQFNKKYKDYKKKFKKPLEMISKIMPEEFTDEYYVETFKRLYPYLWIDLEKNYTYWHKKNDEIMRYGKKSRYNFRKPYNFILDCSHHLRKKMRRDNGREILKEEEIKKIENSILKKSQERLDKQRQKVESNLYYVQEIEPCYTKKFIAEYFRTHDLHEKLEIMRELSKYKSEEIISFFYKVNACTRNFFLKKESMYYIQKLGLPFNLRRKKKGKKTYIDNEIVQNDSSPEILMLRLRVDRLERLKRYDVFVSHNSKNEKQVVNFYKELNKKGLVAYIDWVNDKFDLKRKWCNATTAEIIKERIRQSNFVVLYITPEILDSQWCAWELGYADALKKKICLYLDGIEMKRIPQFYWTYPIMDFSQQVFIVKDQNKIDIKQWLSGKDV